MKVILMDIFSNKKSGIANVPPVSKGNVNLSSANVTKEQDIAKQVLDILAPVFGASLPVKFAIQASIMKTDNEKLLQALTDVKNLLNKEI